MNNILIPISPGELVDKASILEIKTVKVNDQKKLIFISNELEALGDSLQVVEDLLSTYKQDYLELKRVNEKLWDVEDNLRTLEAQKCFDQNFIELARSVYQLNDRRAKIKKSINEKLGSKIAEQKEHPQYN